MPKIIKIFVWIIIISIGLFWFRYQSFVSQKVSVDFVEGYMPVEKGETFASVLSEIFGNKLFVKLYLRQNPPDFQLQAGKYQIPSGNIQDILSSLKKPINETDEFITILEGWNIFDIDEMLTKKGLITVGNFINFVTICDTFCSLKTDYAFISDAETLEGFLYPDTYAINPNNFNVEILVRKMLTNFQLKVIDSGIITDKGTIEILDIINLASIVEKEERNPKERPKVAGILQKRLDEGWMLGADITVCYAHKLTSEQCKLSVTKYLYEKNEYNTRQMYGLPRGPIGNPSAESIEAVVNPEASPYYYYLHDTLTGQIYYAKTNSEHEENKRRYLR